MVLWNVAMGGCSGLVRETNFQQTVWLLGGTVKAEGGEGGGERNFQPSSHGCFLSCLPCQ